MNHENLAHVVYDTPEVVEITGSIGGLNTSLKPKLLAPSPEDMKGFSKLGPASINFVTDSVRVIRTMPLLTSPLIKSGDVAVDWDSYEQLKGWRNEIGIIFRMLDDTITLIGSDLLHASLKNYKFIKDAAESDVAGAQVIYEQLKVRFENMGHETEVENPANPQ